MERSILHSVAEEFARIGASASGALRRERLVQLVIDRDLSLTDLLVIMDIMESWGEPVESWATAG